MEQEQEEQGRRYKVHIRPEGSGDTLCGLRARDRIVVPSSEQMAAGTCGTCLEREQAGYAPPPSPWELGPSVREAQERYAKLRAEYELIPHGEGSPAYRLVAALRLADQMHVLHEQIMRALSGYEDAMATMTTMPA